MTTRLVATNIRSELVKNGTVNYFEENEAEGKGSQIAHAVSFLKVLERLFINH